MTRINSALVSLSLLLAAMMSACSSGSSESVKKLLATVPDDAQAVAVVNVEALLAESGSTLSGDKLSLGADAQKQYDALPEATKKKLAPIVDGTSGISLDAAVVFVYGINAYATGLVSSEKDFAAYLKTIGANVDQKEGDLTYGGEYAYNAKQFWICLGGTVQPQNVATFAGLDSKKSYLKTDYASHLAECDDAVSFVADIASLLKMGGYGSMSQVAGVQMGLQSAFKDAKYFAGTVDVDKKQAELEINVLDSKYRKAELLLPMQKINPSTVSGLDCTADLYVALGVSRQMMDKFYSMASTFGGNADLKAIRTLSGTVAVALSSDNSCIKGVMDTEGKNGDLVKVFETTSMLPGLTASANERQVFVSKGVISGPLASSMAAKALEGAYLGAVYQPAGSQQPVMLLVKPDDKSVKIEVKGDMSQTMPRLLR